MDRQDGRHVVDIELGCAGDGANEPARCCAVCTEPLACVTVGSCGHGAVRPVEGDRCCSVCGSDYPSVIVAKAADGTRGGGGGVPALTQQPASEEGKVDEYWYHGDTAAYFPDEQQNAKARGASWKENLVAGFITAVCTGLVIWAIVVTYPGP